MVDDLIAIAALLEIALTAFMMIRYRRKPFPWLHVLIGLGIAAILGSIFFPVYGSTGRGGPLHLLAITYFCFGIAFFFPLARRTWSLALFFFTLAMAIMLPGLAGRLRGYTFLSHEYTRSRDSLRFYLEDLARETESYPAGWLVDEPFATEILQRSMQGWRYIPHSLWHSRFSGIYRLEVIQGETWYPGGSLKTGIRKIEIRPR